MNKEVNSISRTRAPAREVPLRRRLRKRASNSAKLLDLQARCRAGRIVGDEDFVAVRRHGLRGQRGEATAKHLRPAIGGHHNRDAKTHADGFSSRYEPITNASRGEVQKHSTASRGVQTIGSPRVLNDVFTSTGTPVRAANALSKS
jgi:hypothetical protein